MIIAISIKFIYVLKRHKGFGIMVLVRMKFRKIEKTSLLTELVENGGRNTNHLLMS